MALLRKSRRSTRKRANRSRRKVYRRRQRGGGQYELKLNIAQPPVAAARPPPTGSPQAKALADARAAAGNIRSVSVPPEITGFTSAAKSAKITFKLPAGTTVTKLESIKDGQTNAINIPVTETGTGIKANVSGQTVTISNVSSGAGSLNILGGESGNFTLRVTTP